MVEATAARKEQELRDLLASLGSVVVSFSGGVDSSYLLKIAHDVQGNNAIAATGLSQTYAAEEMAEADVVARDIGAEYILVDTAELTDPRYADNTHQRCFFCKSELYGKLEGCSHGYGGSMHLLDVERRFLGGWGIVGGQLPIAVGAALALDYRGEENVVLCQLGDGATNTGAFHEALNLAEVWSLPIVFQVLNNQYGMGTSVAQASAEPELWKRATAYRMHGERVDGNDIVAVHEAALRCAELARVERRPSLLETITYRWRGHSVADAGKVYRTREEIEEWKERDPIARFAARAQETGVLDDADVIDLKRSVNEEVADAIRAAAAAPAPDVARLYDNVYGDPDSPSQFDRMGLAGPFGEREETRTWRT